MRWLRSIGLFRSTEILGIARETLQFALDAAADTHPDEYMGLLRGQEAASLGLRDDGLVITDVLVIPGTSSNSTSARMSTNMIPNDVRSVGSIHSHPSGVIRPSNTDRDTFGAGQVHIIMGAPYGPTDWQAFDQSGNPRDLAVIDVRLPDPSDFFDFTEADLDLDLDPDPDT